MTITDERFSESAETVNLSGATRGSLRNTTDCGHAMGSIEFCTH
jgi:hypothetical protein